MNPSNFDDQMKVDLVMEKEILQRVIYNYKIWLHYLLKERR